MLPGNCFSNVSNVFPLAENLLCSLEMLITTTTVMKMHHQKRLSSHLHGHYSQCYFLFIDTLTKPRTTIPIRQFRRHVLRLFLFDFLVYCYRNWCH